MPKIVLVELNIEYNTQKTTAAMDLQPYAVVRYF